jgi:hypothetical protein
MLLIVRDLILVGVFKPVYLYTLQASVQMITMLFSIGTVMEKSVTVRVKNSTKNIHEYVSKKGWLVKPIAATILLGIPNKIKISM